VPRQRESVYFTSTLNTFLRYNGHRHIGGPSTTHRCLAPLPKEPSRISLMYLIFLETGIIHLHFPADTLCLSVFNFFLVGAATSRKTFVFLKEGCFSRSRSYVGVASDEVALFNSALFLLIKCGFSLQWLV